MSAQRVTLVRHGETEWSLTSRHTGLTDVALTERGRQEASSLRTRLASRRFELVLVSPAARARETCELAGLSERAQTLDELHEWDYGSYEGLTYAEIQGERPGWVLWRDGCPGGESPAAIGARADHAIALSKRVDGEVAIFAHGHFLRVLGARWIGLEPAAGAHLALATSSISVLGYERDTKVLLGWNGAGVVK
jgi:probable phosphoglycerate mutase